MALIDPDAYVVASAVCMSKGIVLHDLDDCPGEESCPVAASFVRKDA